VDGTKAGRPGETFEATGDVGGIGELAAAVAREKRGIGHEGNRRGRGARRQIGIAGRLEKTDFSLRAE
jgi:hypothetical protein